MRVQVPQTANSLVQYNLHFESIAGKKYSIVGKEVTTLVSGKQLEGTQKRSVSKMKLKNFWERRSLKLCATNK